MSVKSSNPMKQVLALFAGAMLFTALVPNPALADTGDFSEGGGHR